MMSVRCVRGDKGQIHDHGYGATHQCVCVMEAGVQFWKDFAKTRCLQYRDNTHAI